MTFTGNLFAAEPTKAVRKLTAGLAKEAEAYETPVWAVKSILDVETLTEAVVDPCAGTGILGDVARNCGYDVWEMDKYQWGRAGIYIGDFLVDYPKRERASVPQQNIANNTVLMNPPFSLAEQFVDRCFELGARKIVCFQRFAWWESMTRREWWGRRPPNRVYICGNRATCWRFDIPEEKRKTMGNTTTAHAWYIWERGHPPGTVLGHIYKGK